MMVDMVVCVGIWITYVDHRSMLYAPEILEKVVALLNATIPPRPVV